MIWKDYLKLSEIAGYSNLARVSKAPPPLPGEIGLRLVHTTDTNPDADRIIKKISRHRG